MKVSKLQIENFKAIVSAELELGPGLNVLYGPNDLGKSTLGVALRAALLLPSNSSTASAFVPWQEATSPVVALTFLTELGKHWRVVKRFTENDATLSFSKDGKDFSVDSHERVADERLRKLLGWGIPSPGGRTGARGMPESFIANALLSGQTDVDAILSQSLEGDGETSGKIRLTAALSALAQHPLVRHVLDRAQKEHEQHFTVTGRKKGGQNAPLTVASDHVKKLTSELMQQQQALSQSAAIEAESRRLKEVWLEAQHQVEHAEERLKRARAGLQRSTEKRLAEQKLAVEQQALAQVDALAARVQRLGAEVETFTALVKEKQAALDAAQQAAKRASQALRDAEEAHRKASSADGEAERTVARANLKEELSQHAVSRAELSSRLEKARAGARATEERSKLNEQLRRSNEQLGPARAQLSEAVVEASLAAALMNYGHWRTANDAAKSADAWRAEAKTLRTSALERSTEALKVQQNAKRVEEDVTARRQVLPDEKTRAALTKLRRDVDLAEAALGGGVTVMVRPRSQLQLRTTADEGEPEDKKTSKELTIEADRRVQLSIGDLVDIEIVTGAAEKRKDAEHLRKKWRDALPTLERAGVRTLGELDELFTDLNERLEHSRVLRESAEKAEREAESLRSRAGMLDEKAAGAPSREHLEERRAAVGDHAFEALEPIFVGMGDSWESQARPLNEQKSAALTQAHALVAKLEGELKLTEHRLVDLREKAPTGTEDPAGLERSLAATEQSCALVTERIAQLEHEGSGAKQLATARLEHAKEQLAQAQGTLTLASEALTQARADESGRKGERDATAAQLESAQRPEVVARVAAAVQLLGAFEGVEVLTPEAFHQLERAVELARAASEQAGRDFANAEGALSKVGGPHAREEARQLEEAVMVAKAREKLIEVDADAWRLLVEAVREAEQEDSSSLGSALAVPVTQRFAELTAGRYPTVKFGPSLAATGVEVPGTQSSPEAILEALSVGTRDHLATLVRLAIALQLKSAIVLDDHLVHTDVTRLAWFREALHAAAKQTQVIVLTCRPLDYVPSESLPVKGAMKSLDGDATRVIDLSRVIKRR